MNSLIYRAIAIAVGQKKVNFFQFHRDGTEKQLFDDFCGRFTELTQKYLQDFEPEDAVFFAFDGPVPVGKILQQRSRRIGVGSESLSPMVSPGTKFMMDFDEYFTKSLIPLLLGLNLLPYTNSYSSSLENGEAEQKIMDFYRHLTQGIDSPAIRDNGVHYLISPDADLLMLPLLSPLPNIVIIREVPDKFNPVKVNRNTFHLERMKLYIGETYHLSPDEFVLLFFLFGNDFLPKQFVFMDASENSFTAKYVEELLTARLRGTPNLPLITDGQINLNNFLQYLQSFANDEGMKVFNVIRASPEEGIFRGIREGEIGTFNYRWASFHRQSGFGNNNVQLVLRSWTEGDAIDNARRVRDYITSLRWAYGYYSQGTAAVNHDWSYSHTTAPPIAEILYYMSMEENYRLVTTNFAHKAYNGMPKSNVLHQLLSVLTSKTKDHAPSFLHPFFDFNSPIADMTCVQGYAKTFGDVDVMPPFDRWRILGALAALSKNRLSEIDLQRFCPRMTRCYLQSESQTTARFNNVYYRAIDRIAAQSSKAGEREVYHGTTFGANAFSSRGSSNRGDNQNRPYSSNRGGSNRGGREPYQRSNDSRGDRGNSRGRGRGNNRGGRGQDNRRGQSSTPAQWDPSTAVEIIRK